MQQSEKLDASQNTPNTLKAGEEADSNGPTTDLSTNAQICSHVLNSGQKVIKGAKPLFYKQ